MKNFLTFKDAGWPQTLVKAIGGGTYVLHLSDGSELTVNAVGPGNNLSFCIVTSKSPFTIKELRVKSILWIEEQ